MAGNVAIQAQKNRFKPKYQNTKIPKYQKVKERGNGAKDQRQTSVKQGQRRCTLP
jgi:hypothetical protein